MKVYFDHAATTPIDPEVRELLTLELADDWGNANSLHYAGRKAQNALDGAREVFARILHCDFERIYFTSGGTESDNLALKGVSLAVDKKKILTTKIEHSAVLASGEWLKRLGYQVEYLYPDKNGVITPAELESKMGEDVGLVSIMYANNESGVINDVKALANIAHKYGAVFHTDAVQAANWLDLDVDALNVDLLSISSHKVYGPKGVGLLYVRSGVPMSPLIGGGEQERGIRGGTVNIPSIVAFAKALEKAEREKAQRSTATLEVRDYFESRLQEVGAIVNFTESRVPCISNVQFLDVNAQALMTLLDINGIAVSIGSACNSGSIQPSHVLKASGLDDNAIARSLRFSFGYGNTLEEVDYTIDVIKNNLDKLKGKRLFVSRQTQKFSV